MSDSALAHALRLLDRTPLVDGHNDLPWVIRNDATAQGDVAAFKLDERRNSGDTDIPRLREGRVAAQFWAAFVPPKEPQPAGFALQQIALLRRMHETHPTVFLPALRARDIARAKRAGKIASFIAIENGAAIEGRLDALDAYYDLGVRLMTLCHTASIDWCDSSTDTPRANGLSDFGRQVIARMNDLGMIVDLSHVSDAAANQTLDISRAPVVFSHSNARAVCAHPRNLPDDILARAPDKGAIVMATFVPGYISRKAQDEPPPPDYARGQRRLGSLTELCDHIDYLKARVGPDCIGIGSDFFGGPQGEGLRDVACFPHIFAELVRRGWNDAHLKKLAGENFARVFRAVEKAKRQ